MKKNVPVLLLLVFCSCICYGQTATAFWGEEFKLRIRDADLHVAWADKTGVYFIEEHLVLKAYYVIGATARESAGLVKLDKNLNEIYRKNFDKELKKKRYQDIVFCRKKMFLVASDYDNSEKTAHIFTLELNKDNAESLGDWKEICSFTIDKKNDDLKFKVSLTGDSSRFRLVSGLDGSLQTRFTIQEFDENFSPVFNKVEISNEFEPEKYDLEDILPAKNGNILLVARLLGYEDGKKEKKKNLRFQSYNLRLYGPTGSMIKEINTEVEGRKLLDSKCTLLKNGDFGLAAFYSNTTRGKEINGLMMQVISSKDGAALSYASKEISTSLLLDDTDNGDDGEETKAEREERKKLEKMAKDDDGFNRSFKIRSLSITDDGGMAMVAEKSYTYTFVRYSETTKQNITYISYISEEMLISKFDARGEIAWMKLLPKKQQETVSTAMQVGPSNYFVTRYQFPWFGGAGIMTIPGKNSFALLINDNPKNAAVTGMGQKIKWMANPQKSDAYLINIDLASGNITRKFIFSNNDNPPAMFRHGVAFGNIFYVVGKKIPAFGMFAKPKIVVARIVFK